MELKFKHFIALNVLDGITTYYALRDNPMAFEANPLYSHAYIVFGFLFGLVAIKLLLLIVIYAFISTIPLNIKIPEIHNINGRQLALGCMCFVLALVVVNNIYWMTRY